MEALEAVTSVVLLFLVLAVTVETIMEAIRGAIDGFFDTESELFFPNKISPEKALELVTEFAGDDQKLKAQANALIKVGEQIKTQSTTQVDTLKKIVADIENALPANEDEKVRALDDLRVDLNNAFSELTKKLDKDRSTRGFRLKMGAALVGGILAFIIDINVIALFQSGSSASVVADSWALRGARGDVLFLAINMILCGGAASAGSSYWHDTLDRLRSIKSAATQAQSLAR